MKQKIKKSIEKINETKIGFFERINKIDESIARLVRRKKKKKKSEREDTNYQYEESKSEHH